MKRLLLFSMMALTVLIVQAQDRTVSGRIVDGETGEALIGASVTVKDTSLGTVTDLDGNYSLSVPDGATLVVSYVGYITQEIAVGAQTSIDVSLASDAEQLGELVFVGYGSVRKADLTGSVGTVDNENLLKGVVIAPDQAMQGKIAGVQVINNSGQPGGATTIRIRGNSSIRTGNQPLFVIDGVQLTGASSKPGADTGALGSTPPANPLNFINPNDIESMQVLKDASATAIYGSRGANGVVLITTKKGRAGAPTVEITGQVGISNVANEYDILDAEGYRSALMEFNAGGENSDGGNNVDAWDAITRTAITQNHSVAVSGGDQGSNYRVSLGYYDQQGVLKGNDLNRINANIATSLTFLDEKGTLDVGLITSKTDENAPPNSTNAGFEGSLVANALQWNPTYPLADENGPIIQQSGVGDAVNPLALLDGYYDLTETIDIVASVSPSYKINDKLSYKFFYSIALGIGSRHAHIQPFVNLTDIEDQGLASFRQTKNTNQILTQTLNFADDIAQGVNLNVTAGYEYQKRRDTESGVSAIGFKFPGNLSSQLDASDPASRTTFSNAPPDTKLSSFFARAILNLQDNFSFTATFRADGSSKFGANNRFGYFPSFGAAWNAHNMIDLPFDQLKVRLGWGVTGNSEFDAGAAQERWQFSPTEIFQVNAPNDSLVWETSKTLNIGIDFALINYKLTGTIDYFQKVTSDLLFQQTVKAPGPPSARYWENLSGEVVNSGVELALDYQIFEDTDLSWNFGVNVTYLSNVLQNYNGANVLYGELFGQGVSGANSHRLANGQPLNSFYMSEFTGLDSLSGNSTFANDGAPDFVGDPNQDIVLGINTVLSVKDFTFSLAFNGAFGHDIYNNTRHTVIAIGNLGNRNISRSLLGSGENTANVPSVSSRYLEKGDYLKLNNATVAYNIGDLGAFKKARVFVTGNNLFVLTNYSGFDPEVNVVNQREGLPSYGIEYTPYPSARSFVLGVNFSL